MRIGVAFSIYAETFREFYTSFPQATLKTIQPSGLKSAENRLLRYRAVRKFRKDRFITDTLHVAAAAAHVYAASQRVAFALKCSGSSFSLTSRGGAAAPAQAPPRAGTCGSCTRFRAFTRACATRGCGNEYPDSRNGEERERARIFEKRDFWHERERTCYGHSKVAYVPAEG